MLDGKVVASRPKRVDALFIFNIGPREIRGFAVLVVVANVVVIGVIWPYTWLHEIWLKESGGPVLWGVALGVVASAMVCSTLYLHRTLPASARLVGLVAGAALGVVSYLVVSSGIAAVHDEDFNTSVRNAKERLLGESYRVDTNHKTEFQLKEKLLTLVQGVITKAEQTHARFDMALAKEACSTALWQMNTRGFAPHVEALQSRMVQHWLLARDLQRASRRRTTDVRHGIFRGLALQYSFHAAAVGNPPPGRNVIHLHR